MIVLWYLGLDGIRHEIFVLFCFYYYVFFGFLQIQFKSQNDLSLISPGGSQDTRINYLKPMS
jgi:hypothetical protein